MITKAHWMALSGLLATGAAFGCSAEIDPLGSTSKEQGCSEESFYPGVSLYVPKAPAGSADQIKALTKAGEKADAKLIKKMTKQPAAVWLEHGTPKEVKKQTQAVVEAAAEESAIPVLVAYNIPFRDCAQFSAGGATSPEEYLAWVGGVAEGIGDKPAIVILEPDGLGIIPYWTNPFSGVLDWCQPAEADPATAASDRLAMLNAAVDLLMAKPEVRVYLDGTHSAWIGVGEIASRLKQAGVDRATGVFYNASNYRSTEESLIYGRWVSSCLDLAGGVSWWDPLWCPGQYAPDATGAYVLNYTPEHVAAVDAEYAGHLTNYTAAPIVVDLPFVLDTSRNGVGPWTPPADHPAGDAQDWCNPPDRGLGLRPTTDAGVDLVDAYLWIKTPGESDGSCNRWEPAGSPDPVRGMMDPAAGVWFPEQALELATFAVPAL